MAELVQTPALTIMPPIPGTGEGLALEPAQIPEAPEALPETVRRRQLSLSSVVGGVVSLIEVTPLNETIRLAAVGAASGISHDSLTSAVAFGAATLAVEGVGALGAAEALSAKRATWALGVVRRRMEKWGYGSDREVSRFTKAAAVFLGGSVVGMAVKKFEQPDSSSKELRDYGLKASMGLAAACGAIGLAGPEAIDYVASNPAKTGIGVAGVTAVAYARKMIRKIGNKERIAPEHSWEDHDKYGLKYAIPTDPQRRAQATKLEQDIWDENDYGDLEEEGYTKYFDKSLVLAAFEGDECVGMTRMFRGTEELPPFIDSMKFEDENDKKWLAEGYHNGEVEELGTAAVAMRYRGKQVNSRLWRLAYRDAINRGVKYWGIIMEPERVQEMNKKYGFTFRQLGPAMDYQGGDCAAHVLDLKEVDASMRKSKPLTHYWFVKRKLRQ